MATPAEAGTGRYRATNPDGMYFPMNYGDGDTRIH
jgi:hypothetical protein